jgi:hypothetical protein
MLNTNIKNKAIQYLEASTEAYNAVLNEICFGSEKLYDLRHRASSELIVSVESYINELANKPKEFSKSFINVRTDFDDFNHYVATLQEDANHANLAAGGATGAGVMMAAGVATLGPTTAIAIATTFGAASTGTAIASLSGAAATNAALAWLGGGAIAAGGGGMAAGEALLVLAGPVGWGIAGVAIVGGGFWMRHKNQEISKEATTRKIEIDGYRKERVAMLLAIKHLITLTAKHMDGITDLLSTLSTNGISDYQKLDTSQKDMLHALVNHTHTLGQLLKKMPEEATQS